VRSNAFREAEQMAADGDFEGAFARIDKALEILPEDEQLTQKAEDLRVAFVGYVTGKAVALVDAGDFDEAYGIVEEASELYSCEALDALYEQIEEGESGPDLEMSEYTAAKVAFTEYPGEIRGTVKKQEYAVKAAGGPCSFFLTKVEGTLKAQITVKGPEGTDLLKQTGLVNGSEVNCSLEKDKTYTVSVEAAEGEGKYVLLFGQNKEVSDVSDFDLIRDSMEFKGQYNSYSFVPENSGTYRFDVRSADKELVLKIDIYDARNGKIFGDNLSDGTGATLELNAGEAYRIYATQIGKIGEYALAIGKQESSSDITGKCIVPGAVTYKDQKKAYTFTAAESGKYQITIGNMNEGCSVKMYVYSQLGDRLEGADEMMSGDSLSVILKEGQSYQIRLTQLSGIGNYTITMVKE
jgi:tetratricopeptide (TPR) repeat protein